MSSHARIPAVTAADYASKLGEERSMIFGSGKMVGPMWASSYGFSQAELQSAFNLVCDLENWKRPIDATVHASLVQVVLLAIKHFTGTQGTVAGVAECGRIRITAPGYYAGPCN